MIKLKISIHYLLLENRQLKRRNFLKLVFGSLVPFVVPVFSKPAQAATPAFVSLCNIAIAHEYGAIVQYINHSGLITDKRVKEVLDRNMRDEIIHARRLTEILVKEGATPTIAVWPPQTGKGIKKLIEEDIEGENAAIKLYSQILELSEAKRYKDDIYSFLKREETHRSRLVGILGAIKNGKI